MTDETKQKILGTALKIFAEKGYKGATTLIIAEKAGFSEKTLFRKFKTKENLFNSVIIQGSEKLEKDFKTSILLNKKFKDHRDFLETLIQNLAELTDDNYEYISLTINESSKMSGTTAAEGITYVLSDYIERNIQNKEIDYQIFAVTILSFIYTLVGEKYQGGNFLDRGEALKKFTNNLMLCIR